MMAHQWYGWAGTILRVDLTKEQPTKQPLTKELAYNFLGGRGFNIKTLWDEIRPGTDPLGPENVLCLAIGPMNGTIMPLCSRMNVSCKSALTGIFGDGNAGGNWPVELKFAGYDQIVFTGKAKKPVYLWIEDDDVEIRDAQEIWGTSVFETNKILMKEHGKDIEICSIGQAGENLVRVASTMSGLSSSSTPGSGAVWGSKNLKAVAVKGTKGVKIAKFDEFVEMAKKDHERLLAHEHAQARYGTVGTAGHVRYWIEYHLDDEEFEKLNGMTFLERYIAQLKSCYNCPLHGKRFYRVLIGPYAGTRGSTVEGSPLTFLSGFSKIFDWPTICKINNICNQYGLDAEMAYYTISLAMELYNNHVITKEDLDGMPLEYGDDKAVIEILHKMAMREGFGNKMAEGVYNFAKIIGSNAVKYCTHTKGMTRSWDGYAIPFGLTYLTSTRGADHLRCAPIARIDPEVLEKRGIAGDPVEETIWGQHEWVLIDSLERCKCGRNTWEVAVPLADPFGIGRAKMLSAATGWAVTPKELDLLAERIYNLERAFNVREGVTRKNDTAPPKSFEKGVVNQELIDEALIKYYTKRGWNLKNGVPSRMKLEQLRLKYVADELEANMPYPEWDGPFLWPLDEYPSGGNRVQ
ncbi:MAG: aldehyde ferredoxin oxidoreductase family protein [Candidatus Hodarchaeota archaeon]